LSRLLKVTSPHRWRRGVFVNLKGLYISQGFRGGIHKKGLPGSRVKLHCGNLPLQIFKAPSEVRTLTLPSLPRSLVLHEDRLLVRALNSDINPILRPWLVPPCNYIVPLGAQRRYSCVRAETRAKTAEPGSHSELLTGMIPLGGPQGMIVAPLVGCGSTIHQSLPFRITTWVEYHLTLLCPQGRLKSL